MSHELFTFGFCRRKIDAGAALVEAGPFRADRTLPNEGERLWHTGQYGRLFWRCTTAIAAEKAKARRGHWSYDENRRIGLAQVRCAARRARGVKGHALLAQLKRNLVA